MKKKILVLGSTGSIGKSAIDIIRSNPDLFELSGATAHKDTSGLDSVKHEFPGAKIFLSGTKTQDDLLNFISQCDADIAVNGISGASGLLPSKAALESGMDLALANKETIVMAGPLIRKLAARVNKKILPVDSEHSAVFNLIEKYGPDAVSQIILTASGGPFRSLGAEDLKHVKAQDALKHPTWSMGSKITIDSASLANKGLEVIEACRLFDIPPDRVKVVVHPQSLIHSLIRTKDGVLYAQLSKPDMRHPILSALTWPQFVENTLEQLDFDSIIDMRFEPPRYDAFPLLGMAYRAAAMGGSYTIAYNAANEVAVEYFLNSSISFPSLAMVTASVLERDWTHEPSEFSEIGAIDRQARKFAVDTVKEVLK